MEAVPAKSSKSDEKKATEKRNGEKKDGQKKVRTRPARSKKTKKEVEVKAETAEKDEDQKLKSVESATKKRTKRNKKKKKLKKEAKEAKESGDFDTKIKLKVIVRRLPPNLPEHIFWQAASPWVLRSDTTKGSVSTEQISGNLAESFSKAPFADQTYFIPGKLKDGSRRGVQADSSASPHTFSRAYIRFKNTDDLVKFYRGFDGHLFRDAKGNEYIAVVEFAPFQKMPGDGIRRKKQDTLAGTIEEDEDYKQFVGILTQTEAEFAKEKGQGQLEKTDAQLMAHLTSLSADSQAAQKQAKSTPLLEHLRAQRLAKSEAIAHKQARNQANKNSSTAKGASGSSGTTKSKNKVISDPSIPTGPKAMVQKQKEAQKSESGNKKNKKSERLANVARQDKNNNSDHAENNVTQTKNQRKKELKRTIKAEEEKSGAGKITSSKPVTPKIPTNSAKIAILKREM